MNPIFGILLIIGLSIGVYTGTRSANGEVLAKKEIIIDDSKSDHINILDEAECEDPDSSLTKTIQEAVSSFL